MKVSTLVRVTGLLAFVVVLLSLATAVSADAGGCTGAYAGLMPFSSPEALKIFLAANPGATPTTGFEGGTDPWACLSFSGLPAPAPAAPAPVPAGPFVPYGPVIFTRPQIPLPPLVPIGQPGDSQSIFDGSANIPPNALPNGDRWTIYTPDPAGLLRGTFTLRGAGDRLVAVYVVDANGNRVYSFSGNVTVCLTALTAEVTNDAGLGGVSIQMWNGSMWASVPLTSVTPTSNGYLFCTQVNSF